ncbi:ABC transporter G family member 2-like [Vigna unguiculata]|uniref:ABC transporter G family member 2-like n=1 Tax=Vigna unguiculata TaxID=3917 RepID=UPI001015DD59|nr:ABC transporter G family member 2-like [Vigna unguiculata]
MQSKQEFVANVEEERKISNARKEEVMFLTWEDLEVTVPSGRKGRKSILKGLTGYAKPGQLLAVMGPSGSGKSTLLDALAGRLGSNIKQMGKILINGLKQELAYGTSGYVTQDDAMLSCLTSGETLYYSAELQFPNSMSKAEKKERVDATLREMGLQDAINTRVGGWSCKGLSGGQKRRLSICVEILTHPTLLFLDEPTSGLDSAASYYVMTGIASLNLKDGIQRTIVTSIHQPSSEVFQLFHHLCLLSSGETVYFGPASDANQFFSSNGFPCPPLYNPSDHYLRIINKDFNQDADEGITTEEATNILVSSYKSSEYRNQVQNQIAKISENDSGVVGRKKIHAAFLTQCLVLLKRSSKQIYRDITHYWLLLTVFIAVSVSLGSIFYHVGASMRSIQERGSLFCFFISVLCFMILIGGFSPLIEEMKVFKRERLNGHYGITAFLVGSTFSAVPYTLLVSFIPGAIVNYLSGLHKGLDNFVYFASVLFATVMWVESLMMVVGSIFSNFVMGVITAGGVEGLMILTSGFYRLPNDLPKPLWKYPFYHVSFLNYALQGLLKNEFEGLMFFSDEDGGARSVGGRDILSETWQVQMGHSKWIDLAIMFEIMNFVLHEPVQCNVTNYGSPDSSPTALIMQSKQEFVATVEEERKKSNERKEEGMFLTWEDLQVTVPNGRKGRKPILKGLTGYAKPGQLLAVMGPSGSGKSTLLDALAGRLVSSSKQTGKILINGHKHALAYGTSAYVTHDDAVLSTLTVGEAVSYSAHLQFPDSMSNREKKERVDFTIRQMGLQEATDTRIKGKGSKGLSEGQKRRLAICIQILTSPKLLLLDEPSSGLDSAASYYVMTRIASLKIRDGIRRTIVASIHQPSSEVFELFDHLCLLSSGETVYFGTTSAATEFFASNGFPCPSLHNPSDHFLRIINKDFILDDKEGLHIVVPEEEAVDTLVQFYKSSEICNQVQKEVAAIGESEYGFMGSSRTQTAFLTQCHVLLRRSSVHLFRDVTNYWLRLAMFTVAGISLGTIFFDVGSSSSSIQARGSLVSFVASVLTFITLLGGFPPFVEQMKVFQRERLNGHYGVAAFVISHTLSPIPYIVLMSLIPGVITYYLSGLHTGLEQCIYFSSVLFACILWVESLMMVVSSIFPNPNTGITVSGGVMGVMILTGGFFRLPNDLPKPFWKYPMYYVSFHKYAFQGLFKNEFIGLKLESGEDGGTFISDKEILTKIWQVEMGHSKWVDLAILMGIIVSYRLMFLAITKSKEKMKT